MDIHTLNHPALEDANVNGVTLVGRDVRLWLSPTDDDPALVDVAFIAHIDAIVCDGCGDYMLDELSPGVPGRIETETCVGYYCPDCMRYGDSKQCCMEHFGDPDRNRGDDL